MFLVEDPPKTIQKRTILKKHQTPKKNQQKPSRRTKKFLNQKPTSYSIPTRLGPPTDGDSSLEVEHVDFGLVPINGIDPWLTGPTKGDWMQEQPNTFFFFQKNKHYLEIQNLHLTSRFFQGKKEESSRLNVSGLPKPSVWSVGRSRCRAKTWKAKPSWMISWRKRFVSLGLGRFRRNRQGRRCVKPLVFWTKPSFLGLMEVDMKGLLLFFCTLFLKHCQGNWDVSTSQRKLDPTFHRWHRWTSILLPCSLGLRLDIFVCKEKPRTCWRLHTKRTLLEVSFWFWEHSC